MNDSFGTKVYFERSRCKRCSPMVPGYYDRWTDCNVCLGNAGYWLREDIKALWGKIRSVALIRVDDGSGKCIKRVRVTGYIVADILDAVDGFSISRVGNRILVAGKNNETYELVPSTGQGKIR